MEQMQHPLITQIERTGYPLPLMPDRPPVCSRCGQAVPPDAPYGAYDGRVVCAACVDDEWRELTTGEKFLALGFDLKFDA